MQSNSPFASEWRECLRAHYQYVVRANDQPTLKTLTGVLHQVGFSDGELAELALRATMHVDDVPDGFMPDMTVMAAIAQVAAPAPAPAAEPVPELIAVAEAAAQAAEAALAENAEIAAPDEELAPFNPEAPQQMSLF